jgi:hypothetical protein
MADSPALRALRYRHHRAGDHSLCRADACERAAEEGVAVRAVLAERLDEYAEIDPAHELVRLTRRLIEMSEADPGNMALVRELRASLAALPRAARDLDPVERQQLKVATIMAEVKAKAAEHQAAGGGPAGPGDPLRLVRWGDGAVVDGESLIAENNRKREEIAEQAERDRAERESGHGPWPDENGHGRAG